VDIMYCLTLFPYLLGLAHLISPSLLIVQDDNYLALMNNPKAIIRNPI
jgi:hypothetical protein